MKMSDSLNGALGIENSDTLIDLMLPSTTSSIIFLGAVYLDRFMYCIFIRRVQTFK